MTKIENWVRNGRLIFMQKLTNALATMFSYAFLFRTPTWIEGYPNARYGAHKYYGQNYHEKNTQKISWLTEDNLRFQRITLTVRIQLLFSANKKKPVRIPVVSCTPSSTKNWYSCSTRIWRFRRVARRQLAKIHRHFGTSCRCHLLGSRRMPDTVDLDENIGRGVGGVYFSGGIWLVRTHLRTTRRFPLLGRYTHSNKLYQAFFLRSNNGADKTSRNVG